MISTVFLKSTVRPWPSVSRPSSSTWSRMLNTSGWAFSISSSSITEYGPAADRLGELPGLLVADVAGRRADQPADRVPLLELAHVQPDHPVSVAEQRLGQRAGQLGLADAGRAEEQEAAHRPVRVAEPGPGPADRLGDRRDRLVLADDPLVQVLLQAQQPVPLLLGELARPGCRWPGRRPRRCPRRSTSRHRRPAPPVELVDLLRGPRLISSRSWEARSYCSPATAWSLSRCSSSSRRSSSRTSRRGVLVRSRTRAPAWSIRSIALSGRNRSVM